MQTLRQITDLGQFASLREDWGELLRDSASDCVFLTWEWLFTWWRHLSAGRRLALLTVRENGRLTAIAPFAQRAPNLARFLPSRSIEFLGSGTVGSDYLDVVVRRGAEPSAVPLIADWLCRGKMVLTLSQLNARSAAFAVAEVARREGWSVSAEKTNVCPYIDLTGLSWESYLATRSANQRYNFGRQFRNLQKRFRVTLERVVSEEQREKALNRLWALHRLRWAPRGGSDAFGSPSVLSFHSAFTRLALERGWLRLYLLLLDDTPAAALYGLMYQGKFLFYQSGFDPEWARRSIGMVTLGLAIKDAIREEAVEFDMLHGDEQYKFHWAGASRSLTRLELYPPDAFGRLCRNSVRLNRISRQTARALLYRRRTARVDAVS